MRLYDRILLLLSLLAFAKLYLKYGFYKMDKIYSQIMEDLKKRETRYKL